MNRMWIFTALAGLVACGAPARLMAQQTDLHNAAAARDAGALTLQLKRGADPDALDARGETPLFAAIRAGRVESVRRLLDAGASVKIENARGSASLHVLAADGQRTAAAKKARRDIGLLLLSRDADVNAVDAEGRAALHIALARQRDELLGLLIEHGADVNMKDQIGRGPLAYAAQANLPNAIELLLKHGARLDRADNRGDTALHIAASRLRSEAVTALLNNGANAATVNNKGENALHVLAAANPRCPEAAKVQVAIAEQLLAGEVELNQRDAAGTTALSRALQRENYKLARLLTAKGGVK